MARRPTFGSMSSRERARCGGSPLAVTTGFRSGPPMASGSRFNRIARVTSRSSGSAPTVRAQLSVSRNRTRARHTCRSRRRRMARSEEHTSELQSRENLVCRLLLEKKKKKPKTTQKQKKKKKKKKKQKKKKNI